MSISRYNGRGTPAPSEVGSSRLKPQDPNRIVTSDDEGNNDTKETNFKVAKPDFYYRDRNKLDDQLNQIDMYILFNKKLERKDVTLFTTTFLRGRA